MVQNNSQQNFNDQPLKDMDKAKAQNGRSVQQQLEELEAQVYQTSKETPATEPETESNFRQQLTTVVAKIRNWFNELPQVGKIIVAIVAIMVSFSILNLFLHLLTNLITLAILSLILYGLYKYLFPASKAQ
ncbi:MAG TPA: hypothetical protein ACFCUY_15585 [Xenococcaceae cyanobacterium]